jgi:hypothetical protein
MIYYYTVFQDGILSGTTEASISEVHIAAMLVLFEGRNCEAQRWRYIQ